MGPEVFFFLSVNKCHMMSLLTMFSGQRCKGCFESLAENYRLVKLVLHTHGPARLAGGVVKVLEW